MRKEKRQEFVAEKGAHKALMDLSKVISSSRDEMVNRLKEQGIMTKDGYITDDEFRLVYKGIKVGLKMAQKTAFEINKSISRDAEEAYKTLQAAKKLCEEKENEKKTK